MSDSSQQDSLRFHQACIANCRQLETYIGPTIQPVLERNLDPLPYRRVCFTLLLRVRAWLSSLGRLDSPRDFQAVSAGCRSIFETAIDMVLIHNQEGQSIAKLLAWQRSGKLKYARRVHALSQEEYAQDFIKRNEQTVQDERTRTWGNDRKGKPLAPDRWTGRSLEEDAKAAERYHKAGFVRFYAERYATACWHVHGSGVMGILEVSAEGFPEICAIALRNACSFGIVCAEYALRLFNVFDNDSQHSLARLQEEMGVAALAIWKGQGAAAHSSG